MANSLPSVFISYNPNSELERVLAFRLHTLGAVHGYTVSLPDRIAKTKTLSPETRLRIQHSEYFILFSTSQLSKTVQEEIQVAWEQKHDKTKIIVIYDGVKNLKGTEYCTEIYIDSGTMNLQQITDQVIGTLNRLNFSVAPNGKSVKNGKEKNVLGGLLIAGLGLLLLGALLED